jgi:cystathionine beta-lyase
MKYNFDAVIDRKNTNSIKYDFARERGMPDGLLPLWVADMDFPGPAELIADIQKTAAHGIFGYTDVKDNYYNAVANWFSSRFGYTVTRKDIVKTPGVVFAVAQAVRAFTRPGEGVIIQTPVYYPFYEIIKRNGRTLAVNPLMYEKGKYTINFDDFEHKIKTNNVKMFLLCSPHNPVGRVWTRPELEQLDAICRRHGVIIVSDEIHCDFVWDGHTHTCFGLINDDAVIATAPSKTFNLAGLQVSNIFIKNADMRTRYREEISASGYSQLNTIGLAACQSAYTQGGDWLEQLKAYLVGNIQMAREFLAAKLPQIKLVEPEGTYLLWLDFTAYGLSQTELDQRIIQGAGLWLDSGTMFGAEGEGFQRINIACPRSLLDEALHKLEKNLRSK